MTRSDVTPASWNSPASLAENTGLSAKQSGWLQNLWTEAGTYIVMYKHHAVSTVAVTSNLKHRLIDTWASTSQNVIDKAAI